MNIEKSKLSGIYKITNQQNGKSYIGSTINFKERCAVHIRQLERGVHHCFALQSAWNKYGATKFQFSILLFCEPYELLKYEQWFFDNLHPEYNSAKVAGNILGIKRSEETKKLMSYKLLGNTRHLGKFHSVETRIKMSMSASRLPKSEEVKAKISKSKKGTSSPRKGVTLSEETKQKISKTRKERKIPSARKGVKLSEETKNKISETKKNRLPKEDN